MDVIDTSVKEELSWAVTQGVGLFRDLFQRANAEDRLVIEEVGARAVRCVDDPETLKHCVQTFEAMGLKYRIRGREALQEFVGRAWSRAVTKSFVLAAAAL